MTPQEGMNYNERMIAQLHKNIADAEGAVEAWCDEADIDAYQAGNLPLCELSNAALAWSMTTIRDRRRFFSVAQRDAIVDEAARRLGFLDEER